MRWVFAVGTTLSMLAYLVFAWTGQINNSIKMRSYADKLGQNADGGMYPEAAEGVDHYGFPVIYRSNGVDYILIGVGSDGVPDENYTLDSIPTDKRDTCIWRGMDTVIVSGRVVSGCLK